MARSFDLVDTLVASGREDFTFEEARIILGVPSPATAKVLRQLRDQGFVDRLSRSHYAVRPLGLLGTSATADDLPLAVAAAFDGHQHRIAYLRRARRARIADASGASCHGRVYPAGST